MNSEDEHQAKTPQNCVNYYITSGGRIWGVKDREKLEGEAQERRDVLGNNFKSAEAAALAKAQLEAWNRLKGYIRKRIITREGQPVLEFICNFPVDEYPQLSEDLSILGRS